MSARRKTRRRFVAANGCSKSSGGGVTCSDLLVESIHEEKTPEEFNEQTKHSEVGESEARATCCTGSQPTTDWQCLSRQRLSLASAQSHSAVWRRSTRRGFTPHSAAMHLYGDHPHREAPLYTIQQQRGQGSSIGAVQHVYFNGDRE